MVHARVRLEVQQIAIEQRRSRAIGPTECPRPFDDQLKDRSRVARRSRHHLQHIDGRGLLFDTLAVLGVALCQFGSAGAELTKRPGACNGNHRLFGKGLHQSDLGVVEPPVSNRNNTMAPITRPPRSNGMPSSDLDPRSRPSWKKSASVLASRM